MAKTSMVERDKRRVQIAKKYAVQRAQLKETIRDPKTSPEDKAGGAGQAAVAPAGCKPHPPAQSLPDHWPFAWRVSQIWTGAHQDP